MAMLERVKESSYESPPEFSPELARLLAEVTLLPGFWGPHCPRAGCWDFHSHCPLSVRSCCATIPCTAYATSTTSRATPSSAGWPSTLTCCRRTRWWWQWPRDPPSSPHPTPPLSPILTATSPPRRTGPGLAEPPRLRPSASLRDIPLPRQRVGPCWAGSLKGLPGIPQSHPRVPRLCTSPRGSNKPESRGHCCGCCPDSWGGKRDHLSRGGVGAGLGAVWGGFPGAGDAGGAGSACPSFRPSVPVHGAARRGRDQRIESRPFLRPPPVVAPPQRSLRGVTRARRSQSEPRVVFKPARAGGGGAAPGTGTETETEPNPTRRAHSQP